MNDPSILFLGPAHAPVLEFLRSCESSVVQTEERLSPEFLDARAWTFLVSHGYRYLLKPEVLARFPDRAINLHISLLPWNRGADPNFWSLVEDTPRGVSIHYLDEGLDTGDLIVQREVEFDAQKDTLASTYATLQEEIARLFQEHWKRIRQGSVERRPQQGAGSEHRVKDRARLDHLLCRGWQTPIHELEAWAATGQLTELFTSPPEQDA